MFDVCSVQPLLSSQPVLSGHFAIPQGRPLNTGSTVFTSFHHQDYSLGRKTKEVNFVIFQTFFHLFCLLLRSTKEERTPNTDSSRDCIGQRCRGWMDLGTYIWHPRRFFCRADDITKEREPGAVLF